MPLGSARAFRSRSRHRTTKNHVFYDRRGHSDQVGVNCEGTGSLGRRRAVSQVWHAVAHYPFPVLGCSNARARLDRRAQRHRYQTAAVCRCRAALGVVHTLVPSQALGLARGSFERRYNHRLHQTAPREHRSHAGHGQPRSSPARIGARVSSTSVTLPALACREPSVDGAVDHGLSGRAAPLVNRSR